MDARVERRGQRDQHSVTTPKLVEHFFRHEYGRLVATLSRRVGVQHIEAVEDAAQSALLTALESWTIAGVPDDPSAWLVRVARNHLLGELRQRTARRRLLERNAEAEIGIPENDPEIFLAGEVRDDLLRMLFVCCDKAIPVESQLVLALKSLCGFGVREIALRLFTSEANVYKRLGRARSRLRNDPPRPGDLTGEQYSSRLPSVNKILYLLFTEGYLSAHAEMAIRRELCNEAIRLATILAEHPVPRSGNVRPVGADASARGTDDRSPGRIRRVALVGGAEPSALGPRGNSGRIGSGWPNPHKAIGSPDTTRRPGSRRHTASPPRFRRLAGTRWWSATRCWNGSHPPRYTD